MRLNEIAFGAALPVDGYGPGFFRIGGKVVRGPVLIGPAGVGAWGGLGDTAALAALGDGVDVLLLGMGRTIAHPPASLRDAVEAAGLALEPMDSAAAARTYNMLLAEGRRVAAALLPVA
ncbi:MAG: Mth938-like domain-containing protein [Defluviimonas sp.]|uniref:Mth938-like domain-containing protein n=1 Tax=Albidovulum sp. TaxID=1872424 RepID=UPI001D9CE5D8|nr:Mth938-like domain-containing protein [Paracoccaceae bacterium]MCC0064118.1 Mth938-like domain-containing protein [Defluviimonas sp.]